MSASPAGVIRQYLEENDGQTEVPMHNLLTTWEIDSANLGERKRIAAELREHGVKVEPGLGDLGRDDQVLLTIDEGESEPAGAVSAPPWQQDSPAQTEEATPEDSVSPPSRAEPRRGEPAAQAQRVQRQPEPGPGWFPNKHGPGQRYWDGAKWTDSYRDFPQRPKKQRTFLKVMLGVIIGGCVLIGGCFALLAGGVNEADKEQKKQGITLTQFRSISQGTSEGDIKDQLGKPEDAQEFEDAGVPGVTGKSKSSCIYYPEKGKGIGEGHSFQFCFDNGKLTGKNAY
jgi:hypothetical protein